jgi:hypothetical protein
MSENVAPGEGSYENVSERRMRRQGPVAVVNAMTADLKVRGYGRGAQRTRNGEFGTGRTRNREGPNTELGTGRTRNWELANPELGTCEPSNREQGTRTRHRAHALPPSEGLRRTARRGRRRTGNEEPRTARYARLPT